jgi:hypothetical protein
MSTMIETTTSVSIKVKARWKNRGCGVLAFMA